MPEEISLLVHFHGKFAGIHYELLQSPPKMLVATRFLLFQSHQKNFQHYKKCVEHGLNPTDLGGCRLSAAMCGRMRAPARGPMEAPPPSAVALVSDAG